MHRGIGACTPQAALPCTPPCQELQLLCLSPSWHRSLPLNCLQISCEAYREVVQKDPRFLKFFQQGTPVNELGRMNIGSRWAPCVRLFKRSSPRLWSGRPHHCSMHICSLQASWDGQMGPPFAPPPHLS